MIAPVLTNILIPPTKPEVEPRSYHCAPPSNGVVKFASVNNVSPNVAAYNVLKSGDHTGMVTTSHGCELSGSPAPDSTLTKYCVAGTGVAVGGTGVAVGGTGVAVGGTGVAVGGTGVAVGGTGVAVGGTGVAVGGTGVAVGGTGVAVGGTGVAVGGTGVAVGGTSVAVGSIVGSGVAVGGTSVAVGAGVGSGVAHTQLLNPARSIVPV